jgi:class 3 adenylate cyclase
VTTTDLPEGTVTFLFTDLEGSTALLQAHPAAYRNAIARHHALLRGVVEGHGGVVFETVGDAVYAAFARPTDAVAAALAGQLALRGEDWGELGAGAIKARMGLHTGEVERQGAHYFGAPLYRCARLTATAHGGQTVLSEAAAALVRGALPAGATLLDLEGQGRLAHAAGAGQGEQACRPEQCLHRGQLPLPADEAGELHREVVGARVQAAQGREGGGQARARRGGARGSGLPRRRLRRTRRAGGQDGGQLPAQPRVQHRVRRPLDRLGAHLASGRAEQGEQLGRPPRTYSWGWRAGCPAGCQAGPGWGMAW